MNIRTIVPDQPTIVADAFESYQDSACDCIPLFRYTDESKKHGRARKDGKRPLDNNWTRRTYDSKAVIARCIRDGRNMGVRLTARQLVVDVDPRNGGDVGFKRLCKDRGLDPSSWPCVNTGSGGRHYYLTLPAGVKVVDTLKHESDTDTVKFYCGVEFKSAGRQVVAAGSIHPDTLKPYEWDTFGPSLADAPEAPADLVEAITRPERSGEAIGGGQYSQEQIANALDALDVTKFREHDDWLHLMMACHHASNGDARSEWIEWSTQDPKHCNDAEIIGRRWDSLHTERHNAVTYKTLNHILAKHGKSDRQVARDATEDFGNEPIDYEPDKAWQQETEARKARAREAD